MVMEPLRLLVTVVIFTGSPGLCSPVFPYINVATYNTGLTPRVPEYAVRKEAIGSRLRCLEADVMCLQEVWSSSDMERILSSLGSRYQHSYSALHNSVGAMKHVSPHTSPCGTPAFQTDFLPCLQRRCDFTLGQVVLLTCAYSHCGLMSLDQQCITCLVLADPATAIQSCLQSVGSEFNVPGLLLLSDLPIHSVNITNFVPGQKLLLPRAYISAKIEGLGTVACTHTTANLGPQYFEVLNYSSWEEQNLEEARALVETLEPEQTAVVMGDLNSSPTVCSTQVSSDFEEHYHYFRGHGYQAAFVDGPGICTWCTYNPLTGAEQNAILDHVLLRGHTPRGVMRILDEPLENTDFPLSDHYGIMVTVDRTAE